MLGLETKIESTINRAGILTILTILFLGLVAGIYLFAIEIHYTVVTLITQGSFQIGFGVLFFPLMIYIFWIWWSRILKFIYLHSSIMLYVHKGDFTKAEQIVEKLLVGKNIQRIYRLKFKKPYIIKLNEKLVNKFEYYYIKSLLETIKKNYNKALEYTEEMIKMLPKNWVARYNKACLESLGGRREEAIKSLKEAIKINPHVTRLARKDEDLKWLPDGVFVS